MAQHGGERKEEGQGDNVTLATRGNSQSYVLRRLARDGQNEPGKAELFKQVTKETFTQQHGTRKKSLEANLPQVKREPQARDKAAAVVGVSGKLVSDAKAIKKNNPSNPRQNKAV